jgi:LysR family transcriptional regulator, low CO2-responsive transcriptional regulator
MNISFRQLRLFKALAETGSVTAAARVMHVTQPTASMQLKELSNAVGMPLFEFVGKKIYLTEAGKSLASSANSISQEWESFEQTISSMKGLKTGSLRIAVVSTAKYFIPRLLGTFCAEHKDVDISLEVLNRDAVIARLEGNLDDMVIMTQPPYHLDIEDEIFLDNPLVCIAPKNHPLIDRKLNLGDLINEDFIIREIGSGTRMFCDVFFQKNKFEPKIRLTLGSNEAIKQSVAGGLGLSIVSIHSLTENDLKDTLTILNVSELPINSQWHIVTLKGRRLSPIARVFHDHLIKKGNEITLNTEKFTYR